MSAETPQTVEVTFGPVEIVTEERRPWPSMPSRDPTTPADAIAIINAEVAAHQAGGLVYRGLAAAIAKRRADLT